MDETRGAGAAAGDAGEIPDGSVEQMEGAVKRLALAGIGAAAVACDKAAEKFDRFVNRGQKVQNEWQDKADDIRRQNAGARGRVQESFRSAMDLFLNSFNVPSKGDIDTINVKLNILSRKLDDIQIDRVRGAKAGRAPSSPPPAPPPGEVST